MQYNSGVGGTWVGGYNPEERTVWWNETLDDFTGTFIYKATVEDHYTIKGSYRWDQNRATGTCEFTLKSKLAHRE